MREEDFMMPKFGFQIEFDKAQKAKHPIPPKDIFQFFNENFGKEFGFKVHPKEFTKEEKINFLKDKKKFFKAKISRIDELLKDLEKPVKKKASKKKKKEVKK